MVVNLFKWKNKVYLIEIYKSFSISLVLFLVIYMLNSYLIKDLIIDDNWLNFILLSFCSFTFISILFLMINRDLFIIIKKNIYK